MQLLYLFQPSDRKCGGLRGPIRADSPATCNSYLWKPGCVDLIFGFYSFHPWAKGGCINEKHEHLYIFQMSFYKYCCEPYSVQWTLFTKYTRALRGEIMWTWNFTMQFTARKYLVGNRGNDLSIAVSARENFGILVIRQNFQHSFWRGSFKGP